MVEREIANILYDEFPRRTTTVRRKTEEPQHGEDPEELYVSRQLETVSGWPTRRLTRDMVEGIVEDPPRRTFTSRPVPEYEEEVLLPTMWRSS